MGRSRGFDEQEVTRAAVTLFAARAYDGLSVDDLVTHLGVHRNSLYKTFGSKRGLYLTALHWYLQHELEPLLTAAGDAGSTTAAMDLLLTAGPALDLLLVAAVERAPVDAEVAAAVTATLARLDAALQRAQTNGGTGTVPAANLTAELLGLRTRARISA